MNLVIFLVLLSGVNLSANESNPNQAEADEICIEAESNVQFDVPALNQESKILNESLMKIVLLEFEVPFAYLPASYLAARALSVCLDLVPHLWHGAARHLAEHILPAHGDAVRWAFNLCH